MRINKEVLKEIRQKYGEAFYILDDEQFKSNFLELRAEFASIYPKFNIAYSYKTNYTPKLCKIVNELGGYAEVVSEMELGLALKIGVEYKNIIWNGPVKNSKSMEDFIVNGGTLNIDNIDELLEIKKISENYNDKIISVGLRCNYDIKDGIISRFGFDVDGIEFRQAIDIINESVNLKLNNLHCHFAKRQIEYWPARIEGILAIMDKFGIIPERVDVGGGMYGKMPNELKKQFSSHIPEYAEYAKITATMFKEYFFNKERMPELLVEPGSALVGDCMYFVGTVKSIKNIREKNYITVLGSQKNISMTGVNPPMKIINMSLNSTIYNNADIVGFTCIEGDVLYKNYTGKVAVNDFMVIGNCGSYSLVMKPPFILPNFPVVSLNGDNIELIKRKETFDDIFQTYII